MSFCALLQSTCDKLSSSTGWSSEHAVITVHKAPAIVLGPFKAVGTILVIWTKDI
ncbi:hypothetical protein CROQUDRAFT_314596 [Cronartium quercuum f. sp. fusiforme G11]|uniref:Uncharacterized protein n=1 Tax=Cronartium quercuum f. sp. fusiforme G11 TaxID=708437 RepID=A0A9P6TIV9_9BASI|nr:hypothetical protein CROQUDRAFT_314596 [Cronartium quercuum f. sp. fusiforme G11]